MLFRVNKVESFTEGINQIVGLRKEDAADREKWWRMIHCGDPWKT